MKKSINKTMVVRKLRYLVFAWLLTFVSCSTNNESNQMEERTTAEPNENPYTLSQSQFQSSEMKLGKLEMREFHQVVKTNGMFDVPPQNKVSVSAYFGGYVKELKLLPGEQVKKGQALFKLENPEYVQMQQDFLEAQGQLNYLKANYERQKNLAQDNITSQKNYHKAEADYTATRVKYESMKKKLGLININPNTLTLDNIRTTVIVSAPISGYVTQVNITQGVYLKPSDVAVSIIDTEHLHLELAIFEKDLAAVAVGQRIKFKIQNDGTQEYDASVYLVNKSVDSEKRTVDIHGHLSDEKNTSKFNPGMYVEAEIYTTSQSKLSLPEEAVVDLEGKYYVLVKLNASDSSYPFERRTIEVGQSSDGYVEILNFADFKEQAAFLTKGAFNLITE